MKYKLQKSHEITKQKLLKQKLTRKEILDKLANPICIQPGDRVYLQVENRRKLDSFYNGPYIVEKIEDLNCTIVHQLSK